ncbi:hypothetical protein [Hymenobacter antarcticus]|uniref:Uncharacterized protein n=1 Tax=Hymenobacter antarcticus TaxID=486270 RepID=A0ABP7PIZ2_9BACT
MKKLPLILLFLLFYNTGFSQDTPQYLDFIYPSTTGYNDLHDTNFNLLWGKKESVLTKEILAKGNFKKVKNEFVESTHVVAFKNLKMHATVVIFYFDNMTGLGKIVISRYYGDIEDKYKNNIILPTFPGLTADSEGVYRHKKNNVTSWRAQSEKDESFIDFYIPYTTLKFN